MSSKPVTRGAPIRSVHMLSADRIHVGAGESGLFTWDGDRWITHRIIGEARDVNGVWVSSDGQEGWGVGANGMLLRYEGP